MWNSYLLGLVTGLRKQAQDKLPDAQDVEELLEEVGEKEIGQGTEISALVGKRSPRRPKHPEKFWKVPRSLTVRKRKLYIRQKKMPKSLLSA